MRWTVCMKNIEVGKWQLITPDMTVDADDPRFDNEVHIVPVNVNPKQPDYLSFGVHDFIRECCCHPQIQELCHSRTIITHRSAVN